MDVKEGVLTASESGGNILGNPCIKIWRKSDAFWKTTFGFFQVMQFLRNVVLPLIIKSSNVEHSQDSISVLIKHNKTIHWNL